jgi:hypothetical protein
MPQLITDVEQLTPSLLTELLRAQETLPRGQVIEVQAATTETGYAHLAHLTLAYSPDAPHDSPRRLFAKLSRHNRGYPGYEAIAGSEVLFYRVFAPMIGAPPLARCYAAWYDPLSGRSHLLLEDITETHAAPRFPDEWPLPPAYSMLEQIVDALVRCQAACWDHARLGDLPGGYPAVACSPLSIQNGSRAYPRFADTLGDRLSPGARRIFERALAAYPILDRRMAAQQHFTVTHGDFLYGNVLLPRNPQQDTVRIVDWELCSVNLGTFDLAEILSLHWDAGPKSERERDLVGRYYAGLLAHGVASYSWEQCWYDYRLALINHLFTPMQQWADQHWPGLWWGRMERTLKRFDDLECAELLKSEVLPKSV